jgi:hypothetical protein
MPRIKTRFNFKETTGIIAQLPSARDPCGYIKLVFAHEGHIVNYVIYTPDKNTSFSVGDQVRFRVRQHGVVSPEPANPLLILSVFVAENIKLNK